MWTGYLVFLVSELFISSCDCDICSSHHMAEHRSHSHTTDSTTNGTSVSWSERLRGLAYLASDSKDIEYERDEIAHSLNYHLDAIEDILCNPRSNVTNELQRCRPNRGRLRRRSDSGERSGLTDSGKNHRTVQIEHKESPAGVAEQSRQSAIEDWIQGEELLSELGTLSKEVTALQFQFMDRRKESTQICDLYEERCRRFKREIAELELEVDEL